MADQAVSGAGPYQVALFSPNNGAANVYYVLTRA